MLARSMLICSAVVALTAGVFRVAATETTCFASCHQFTERCINTCGDPITILCAHPTVASGAGYECVCRDKSTPTLGGPCPKDAAAATAANDAK